MTHRPSFEVGDEELPIAPSSLQHEPQNQYRSQAPHAQAPALPHEAHGFRHKRKPPGYSLMPEDTTGSGTGSSSGSGIHIPIPEPSATAQNKLSNANTNSNAYLHDDDPRSESQQTLQDPRSAFYTATNVPVSVERSNPYATTTTTNTTNTNTGTAAHGLDPFNKPPRPSFSGSYTGSLAGSSTFASAPHFENQIENQTGFSVSQTPLTVDDTSSAKSKKSVMSKIARTITGTRSRRESRDTDHKERGAAGLQVIPEAEKEDEDEQDTIFNSDSDDDEVLPALGDVVSKLQNESYLPKTDSREGNTTSNSTKSTTGNDRSRSSRRRRTATTNTRQSTSKIMNSKVTKALQDFYTNMLSKTLITRSFLYWLPLAIILFIPLAVGAWRNPSLSLGHTKVMWIFIWLEVAWASLFISRVFAHYFPTVAGVVLAVLAPNFVKYVSILAAMEMATTYVFWSFISFISFSPLISLNHSSRSDGSNLNLEWQKIVRNILVALLITSLIYFAERLFIHFLSVSFHRTRFALRIKKSKEDVKLLTLMLDASYDVFPYRCEEFSHEDVALDAGVAGAFLHTNKDRIRALRGLSSQNVQRFVGGFNRVVGSAANAVSNLVNDIGGNRQERSPSNQVVTTALNHTGTSIVLADRIWKSLVLEDAESLSVDDLVDVLGEHKRSVCELIFEKLDTDGNGDLTLEEMENSVVAIGHERKIIYRSLRDVDTAISKLHQILLFCVGVIAIIVFIGMLAPSVSTVLATLGSTLLALSFVFSASAQEVLAACIFLFVKHPLDVGDAVKINMPAGVTAMIVEEVSLLHTTFKDSTTNCFYQAPNSLLNTYWIENMTRSGPMCEPISLVLGLPETTMDDLEKFRTLMTEFIELNPRDYFPDPYIRVTAMPNLDRCTLTVSVTMKGNSSDGTTYGARREKLFNFIGQAVHDIPLHMPRLDDDSTNPALPLYSVQLQASSRPEELSKFAGGSYIRDRAPLGYRHDNVNSIVTGVNQGLNERPSDVHSDLHGDPETQSQAVVDDDNHGTSTGVNRTTSYGSTLSRTVSKGFRRRQDSRVSRV